MKKAGKLTMFAAAALLAAQAQALPAASEWAHEELTNHLAMILSNTTFPIE